MYADKIIVLYDVVINNITTCLSYMLGEHWILFFVFLIFNIADCVTGWIKSHLTQTANSKIGLQGILKKVGYWIMIIIAFVSNKFFVQIGNVIGVDLGITVFLGWFVLANLLINEARSICENLTEAGFNIPQVLVSGLERADSVINSNNQL